MMRKLIYCVVIGFLFVGNMFAQNFVQPVTWSFSQEKAGDNEYVLFFKATVDKGWYLYSQHLDEGGPVPTGFFFEENKDVELVGETNEKGEKEVESFDPIFEMEVKKFGLGAAFSQRVKVTKPGAVLKGSLEFMCCDDTKCLPPETVNFEFKL